MTNVFTHIPYADSCNNNQGFAFRKIKNGGKTIPKCSDLSTNDCQGSGINKTTGLVNNCDIGWWFWEDDCVNDNDTICSINLATVLDPQTKKKKLKYSRNFTNNDYAQACSWAIDSEPDGNIEQMRRRKAVGGRPKNPDIFDSLGYPMWSDGEKMCNASGLEKLNYGTTHIGVEYLNNNNIGCELKNESSCEKSYGNAARLYPTKTGSLCKWQEKSDISDGGCWPNTSLCQELTTKEGCESHPSHLCWWNPDAWGYEDGTTGLCTKYTLLEDTYLNTTNNVPRSDYWYKIGSDGFWESNWKMKGGADDCVPTSEPANKGREVFSTKDKCDSYFYGKSICNKDTLSCSEETINYSDEDETYSSQELCSKNCTAEFGCKPNKDGVKMCQKVRRGDLDPSKRYDSLEECQKETDYCDDIRWGCYSKLGKKSCVKLARGSPGHLSKEECEKKTNYCGNPPGPRFACLNSGNGRVCSQVPSGLKIDPSYISLKACETESNYCGSGPPRKWGCLNSGQGQECSLYPEGIDSPYQTKEECEKGTNFCKN